MTDDGARRAQRWRETAAPLDGRPHLPAPIRSYMGDPRGRWDGNPTSTALRLVERFTLLDANTLQYEVTVHDPQTWIQPWTVVFPLTRDEGYAMYEYACHEGNHSIANMLRGARATEN